VVLQHSLLCVQFADSAGNIAAGALINTNSLSFRIFIIFLLFSERFRGLSHVTGTCKNLLQNMKGLLTSFCFSSKTYTVICFCNMKNRIATACTIEKIHQNKRLLHSAIEYLPAACQGVLISKIAIARGYQILLKEIACRIRQLQAKLINVSNPRFLNFF
jgi:hypothetical protein